MMAHASDFHGDRLRLSAFLRVMGKVPERPKRFQRNRQAPSSLTTQPESVSHNSRSLARPERAPAPVQGDIAGLPDECMPELANLSKVDNVSRPGTPISATEPIATYVQPGSDVEQLDIYPLKAFSAVKRKTKVVYTAKKKPFKQPMGILNAREKHTLPENSLVFVRASTEDGLPLPGDVDVLSAGLTAELDPIQDSQLARSPSQLPNVRIGSRVKPSNKSKQPTVKDETQQAKRPSLLIDRNSTLSGAPVPNRRHRRLRLPDPSSLCDGFEARESLVPVPKVNRRTRQKEISMGGPKVNAQVNKTRSELQLATPLNEHGSQLELVHPSVETDFQMLRQDSPPPCLVVETAIQSQLASITAPLREEDDDSDSPNLDEESKADSLSQWGLQDISESEEPELPSPSSDTGVKGMDYFGEVMYGIDGRSEGAVCSQYPGLD